MKKVRTHKQGYTDSLLGYERTGHDSLSCKRCTCHLCFQLSTSKDKFILFVEWPYNTDHMYQFIQPLRHEQGETQGHFLSRENVVWILCFPSPRLKIPFDSWIYRKMIERKNPFIHTFTTCICAMSNAVNIISDLNLRRRVHFFTTDLNIEGNKIRGRQLVNSLWE